MTAKVTHESPLLMEFIRFEILTKPIDDGDIYLSLDVIGSIVHSKSDKCAKDKEEKKGRKKK